MSRRTEARREQARRAVASDALSLALKAYDQHREDEVPVDELADLAREISPDITK